jgi:hypothetical protein
MIDGKASGVLIRATRHRMQGTHSSLDERGPKCTACKYHADCFWQLGGNRLFRDEAVAPSRNASST